MTARLTLPAGWQAGMAGTALAVGVLAGVDPRLAVAVTLGLAFVFVVMADLTVGLCLFVGFAVLDVLPGIGSPQLSATKFIGLLLALSWLATVATRPDLASKNFLSAHPAFAYLLALFLTWVGLSSLWAESPGVSQDALLRYTLNFLLFLIVFTAVQTRRHAVWVTAAFVGGAILSAVYGVMSSSGSRLGGATFESNELAAVLVAALVLAGALFAVLERSPALRLAAAGAAVLCVVAVFLTLSRAGLVALGLVLVASLVVAARWRGRAALFALLVAVGAVVYFGALASPEARERVTTVEQGTGRLDLWKVGWRMVEDKPLQGVGANNFRISSIHYLLEPGSIQRDDFIVDEPKVAHNVYLQQLAELGVPGLVLFASILALSLGCAARAARRFMQMGDVTMEILARAMFVAMIGILAANFFASGQFSKQLWLLMALGPALLAISGRPPQPESNRRPGIGH